MVVDVVDDVVVVAAGICHLMEKRIGNFEEGPRVSFVFDTGTLVFR